MYGSEASTAFNVLEKRMQEHKASDMFEEIRLWQANKTV